MRFSAGQSSRKVITPPVTPYSSGRKQNLPQWQHWETSSLVKGYNLWKMLKVRMLLFSFCCSKFYTLTYDVPSLYSPFRNFCESKTLWGLNDNWRGGNTAESQADQQEWAGDGSVHHCQCWTTTTRLTLPSCELFPTKPVRSSPFPLPALTSLSARTGELQTRLAVSLHTDSLTLHFRMKFSCIHV